MMNQIIVKNLFNGIPEKSDQELLDILLQKDSFKVERIVSRGHSSPENFWYDQDKNEFVLLISGYAGLIFDDGTKTNLKPGDYLIIPAHKKHRVEFTGPVEKSIWLTIYY